MTCKLSWVPFKDCKYFCVTHTNIFRKGYLDTQQIYSSCHKVLSWATSQLATLPTLYFEDVFLTTALLTH